MRTGRSDRRADMLDAGACWLVPELQMRPIAARRAHVRNPLNGATMELSSGEYAVLSACEGCLPLDDHLLRAAQKMGAPPEHRPAFRELLERCAREGLLMSLPALVSSGDGASEHPHATVDVAIRTCDRPALLARLLASARALEARDAPKRRWLVFDDSRDPQSVAANRAAIAASGMDAAYLGRERAAGRETALCAEFPEAKREIAWLLAPGSAREATYGRPLNHALLELAGRAFVAVDDDVVLEPRRPPMAEPGFAVGAHADELSWYNDEESMWRDCPSLAIDPIAEHERWLGLPLATAWHRAEREAGALADVALEAHHAPRFGADARILFTHSHACGDPGSALLPLQLLTLPALSRRRIAEHPQIAARAFAGRVNWRGQARLRLAPRRILTFTTIAGLDNSRLLPPAAREHRSEDVLLGIAAQAMHPSAWFVDLPFALPHLREPGKQWLSPATRFMQEPLHVIYAWIDENAATIAAGPPEGRLEAMGALLLDYARMSEAKLADALWLHAADAGARTLFAIEEQLGDATLPREWKAQLAPWLRSPALAADDASVRGRTLAPEIVRPLAEVYGRSMQLWPELWRHCRERNA